NNTCKHVLRLLFNSCFHTDPIFAEKCTEYWKCNDSDEKKDEMYLPEGECTSFARIMLDYVSKHYSANIQQAHVLKSSILPFHAFVQELGAMLLSKQLELQQLPTSVSSIIRLTYLQSSIIKARDVIGLIELPNPNDKPSQVYPIEQLQKWNKLISDPNQNVIKKIEMQLQNSIWEFFGRYLTDRSWFKDIQLRFDTKNTKASTLDDEISQLKLLVNTLEVHSIFAPRIHKNLRKLYSNKENIRTLRAKEIMECFDREKSDCHMIDTLKCLNALTDKQISHDRSKSKTLMEQLLQKAQPNLSKEMHDLIKERMNGKHGKDLITSRKNELLYVIKQIAQNPIAQLLLQSMHNINWEIEGSWKAACQLAGITNEQLQQIISTEHLQNFDPIQQQQQQQQALRKLFEDEKSVSQPDLKLCVDILLPITSDDTIQQQSEAAMNRIKIWMQQRRLIDQVIYLEMTQQIAKTNSDMIDIPFICNQCIDWCSQQQLISEKVREWCHAVINHTSSMQNYAYAIQGLSALLNSQQTLENLLEQAVNQSLLLKKLIFSSITFFPTIDCKKISKMNHIAILFMKKQHI
ncbi:hypothetical protein RFI_21736, partial [Reticulomyxa filosa]